MNHHKSTKEARKIAELFHHFLQQLTLGDEDEVIKELPLAQLRLCGVLSSGPRPMSAISRELGTSLSAVTQIADRLERARLVKRVLQEDDRRVRCLQLTKRGQRLIRLHGRNRRQRMCKVLEHLSPAELQAVTAALQILVRAATESRPLTKAVPRAKFSLMPSEVLA